MTEQPIQVRPLPCTHPFRTGFGMRPAHSRGHCAGGCGYALKGSAFEPLGSFCSWKCLEAWKAGQPAPCAACNRTHAGACLEGAG